MKKVIDTIILTVRFYNRNRVSRSSAALSYSLTLSFFPLLICLSVMLGRLNITMSDIMGFGVGIIPASALEFIVSYFGYSAAGGSRALFTAGLAVLLTSSSMAFRTLENTMADIHGAPRKQNIFRILLSFAFSLVFLASVYISCGVILCGEWVFARLSVHFSIGLFSHAWSRLRFVLLFVIMYFMILGVYAVTAPEGHRHIKRGTGAFLAAAALVAISVLFSWFIEMSSKYTLVYGSLASMIILMVWLYLCGNVLIMGNGINVLLDRYLRKNM